MVKTEDGRLLFWVYGRKWGRGTGGGVGKFKSCADPRSAGDRVDFEGPKPSNFKFFVTKF